MKKFLPLLLIAVLAFTACSDKNPLAGKYSGTYTFVTNNLQKQGTLRLVSNPLGNGLLLYGVVPLDYVSANLYETNTDNNELITQLLQYIGNNNNIYNAATETIQNVKIEAKFTGNVLDVDMYYNIQIIGAGTRVSIVKFTGTK